MEPREISRNELQSIEAQYNVQHSVGDLTPTVCSLLGIPAPNECGATSINEVVERATQLTGKEGGIKKVLVFAPDAVGEVHRQRFPELFSRLDKITEFRIFSSTVMPSVTPVCFATIFSGASPQVHGIQQFIKPVLQIETIFDVLAKAGLNVAILARNGMSIDKIFRDRRVDYYSMRTDQAVFDWTKKLLADSDYDFILSYMVGYDHASHHNGPWAPDSISELKLAFDRFEELSALVDKHWGSFNRALVWSPDHGNHQVDEKSGGHGTDQPDDMLVNHFYSIRAGK